MVRATQGNIGAKTVAALCAGGALLFAAAFYKSIEGREQGGGTNKPGTTTFSTSALGHSAVFDLLKDLKLPVDLYRYSSGVVQKRFYGNLVVIAEPPNASALRQSLRGVADAGALLVVLPKRVPAGTYGGPWLTAYEDLASAAVQEVLRGTLDRAEVVRPAAVEAFVTNKLGVVPSLPMPQLVKGTKLTAIVGGPDGFLIGEMRWGRKRLWILSDPDVIANHGVTKGDNGLFAIRVFEALLPPGQRIVFDETVHGFTLPPSLWLALFKPPWIAVTVAFLGLAAVLVFVALNRFGTAIELPQALRPGKQLLIENTAGVLVSRGDPAWIFTEYARAILADTADKLRLRPISQDASGLLTALSEAERGRKSSSPIASLWSSLESAGNQRAALEAAQNIDRWRQEILNDTRRD